jgi:beta-fructofuranosidase
VVFEDRDREVNNIECPNLFKVGSKWVLLYAPHKPCVYQVGSFDLARGKFIPERRGTLDPGTSYANNISYDDKGRCLLWLWGPTNTDSDKGWNGAMVMPRILTVGEDGYLRQAPAPEFEMLRGEMKTAPPAELQSKP